MREAAREHRYPKCMQLEGSLDHLPDKSIIIASAFMPSFSNVAQVTYWNKTVVHANTKSVVNVIAKPMVMLKN